MKLLWDCNMGWLQGWPAQVQVIADGRGSSVIEEVLRFEKNKLFWFFFFGKRTNWFEKKMFWKNKLWKKYFENKWFENKWFEEKKTLKKKTLKKVFKNPENISMLLPWERKKKFCSCEILKKYAYSCQVQVMKWKLFAIISFQISASKQKSIGLNFPVWIEK